MRLKPFQAEIYEITGWHDGSTLNIVEHKSTDLMVYHHERIHGTLITSTIDGGLFQLTNMVARYSTDPQMSENLARLGAHLFEGSRFAHECAATYLGVEALATAADRTNAFRMLPKEYKDYYSFMSGIVDPYCYSSHLRYVVGQAVAFLWFSSSALIDFASSNFNCETLMIENICADWRAKASEEWLKKYGVADALKRAFNAISADHHLNFNNLFRAAISTEACLNDESWWNGLDGKLPAYVEDLISKHCFEYFIEHSNLNCAPYRVIITGRELEELATPLLTQVGIKSYSIETKPLFSPSDEDDYGSAYRDFLVVSPTVIHIRPYRIDSPAYVTEDLLFDDIIPLIERPNRVVNVIFSEKGIRNGPAYVEVFDGRSSQNESEITRFKFSGFYQTEAKTAHYLLHNIKYNRNSGVFLTDISTVVAFTDCGIESPQNEIWLDLISHVVAPMISEDGSEKNPELVKRKLLHDTEVYWYVRDDWAKVLDLTDPNRGKTFVGTVNVRLTQRQDLVLNMAIIDGKDGVYIKAFPQLVMGHIMKFYDLCLKKGFMEDLHNHELGQHVFDRAAYSG